MIFDEDTFPYTDLFSCSNNVSSVSTSNNSFPIIVATECFSSPILVPHDSVSAKT